METYHQQDNNNNIQDLVNKNNNNSYNNNVCRQSSSRWTPTSDQIRILKELYYNNGIRSPTADMIQRIAAQLRQYGKIEGKNVFYWFQNHKARERQKKRFIPTTAQPSPHFPDHHHLPTATSMHHHHYHHQEPPSHVYGHQHKLYTTHHIGVGSSSQGVMGVGCGYGSVAMEKSFRECSISPPGENRGRNFGSRSRPPAVGVDSFSFFVDKKRLNNNNKPTTTYHHDHQSAADQDQELVTDHHHHHQIETLPLFPIHGSSTHGHDFFGMKTTTNLSSSSEADDDHGGFTTGRPAAAGGYYSSTGGTWYRSDGRASLELSLNSSYDYYN